MEEHAYKINYICGIGSFWVVNITFIIIKGKVITEGEGYGGSLRSWTWKHNIHLKRNESGSSLSLPLMDNDKQNLVRQTMWSSVCGGELGLASWLEARECRRFVLTGRALFAHACSRAVDWYCQFISNVPECCHCHTLQQTTLVVVRSNTHSY